MKIIEYFHILLKFIIIFYKIEEFFPIIGFFLIKKNEYFFFKLRRIQNFSPFSLIMRVAPSIGFNCRSAVFQGSQMQPWLKNFCFNWLKSWNCCKSLKQKKKKKQKIIYYSILRLNFYDWSDLQMLISKLQFVINFIIICTEIHIEN